MATALPEKAVTGSLEVNYTLYTTYFRDVNNEHCTRAPFDIGSIPKKKKRSIMTALQVIPCRIQLRRGGIERGGGARKMACALEKQQQ